jgi:hypothetical protein
LAVKSVSGSASTKAPWRMSLKLSVVAISRRILDGRSERAQSTAESIETSPLCTPWLISGRSAARLRYGFASVTAASVVALVRSRRRVRPRWIRIGILGPSKAFA